MKYAIILLSLIFICESTVAQTPYKPKKRKKDFFGKSPVKQRNVGNWALILGAGPSFSKATDNKLQENEYFYNANGDAYHYDITQKGKIGGNASVSLAYFSKKAGWFSFGRLIDYYAGGIGFNYYRGKEEVTLTDAMNRNLPTLSGKGAYSAGMLSARVGIYKTLPITGTKLFVENGLSFHADFNLLQADASYTNFVSSYASYSSTPLLQLNYSLGTGFQLKRGSYLVPSVFVPIFSAKDLGKEAVHWFDSRYYPINLQLKWIYRLNKKRGATNCTTPDKGPMPPPPAEGQK